MCHLLWDCRTLSVQDLSGMSGCELTHWEAWTVISYTYVLALCSIATGFCPTDPGILINFILCDSQQKRDSVECVYNCITALLNIFLIRHNFHLDTDEITIVHFQYLAFDDLKNSPQISFWLHTFQTLFLLHHRHASVALWDPLILWILGPVSSLWCQIKAYLEAILTVGKL